MVNLTADTRRRLRRLREDRKITQFEIAQALGMGLNRYWRIENGYILPKDAECAAIAAYHGQARAELFPELPGTEVPTGA